MSSFVAHEEWKEDLLVEDYYKERCEAKPGGLVAWTGMVLEGDVLVREQSLCQGVSLFFCNERDIVFEHLKLK